MGILDKLFGTSAASEKIEKKLIPWKHLISMEQLNEIIEISNTKPVAIFKHSTRCGISNMVIKQFEREFNLPENSLDLYYLDLLNHRDISNEIAARFQVFHQSPQLLIIKNGVTVFEASHQSIQASLLEKYI
ncbi:MAG: bacillithiol system redox-active protein YtxJ [Bacteroidetes bacterium HGW-Bacteroidetes-2]|jgi:bacillithiol system protein YtxJ|nr:MAG: bacillithiol system redox-active protein YtxJ [Bacteroidetes bacterium HGW-Bacteroidetes-2]